jgi:NADPH-dependent 2,4-dienoyl-CoA reductase/sulfur reductase-like enzyme
MSERLLVIGGDAAGMSGASQARRRRAADDLEIVAFERGDYTSYSACGIPYLIAGVLGEEEDLVTRTPDEFRADHQIDARIKHEVVDVDLEARTVGVRDLVAGREAREPFDYLLIATGGTPAKPPLEGVESPGIFGVQTLGDGHAIRRAIEQEQPKSAVVVGAGYIGIEMAEAFLKRGLTVSVVEQADQPMSQLDPDMGQLVADAMRGEDVDLHLGEKVSGFETSGGRVSAVVTEQRTMPADIVVLGLGTRPNVALAEAAGVPLGDAGGVAVDRRMRTKVEGVWAAGDCAEKFHRVSRKAVTIALGTHANKEGRVAGINIGGGYESFPGVLGTAVAKVCSLEVARTGLKESEATDAGFEFVTATVDSTTRAGYFPGAKPIKTKMIVEKLSGRLLGAQIVGLEGAAKRIDVIAAALWHEMTVQDILNMDLSYAPPFAPVWDPVLITARKAWQRVEETRG